MKTFCKVSGLALGVSLFSACGAEDPTSAEGNMTQDAAVYVSSSSVWPSTSIPVCWENATEDNKVRRGYVKDAIADTWEAVSDVDFTGWEKCKSDSNGIRIVIEDDTPHTRGLGKTLDGKKEGMRLNFTFKKWSGYTLHKKSGKITCKDSELNEYCIRVVAVHEFGHALGFAHEHNREDTPKECLEEEQQQGSYGDIVIGPWDEDSVMNYCNPKWSGQGKLSDTDIEGVQLVYGTGLGGLVANVHSDMCLDVQKESSDDGARLVLNSCHDKSSQRWKKISVGSGYHKIVNKRSGKCLEVDGSSDDNGARIQQWECDGGSNQAWKVKEGDKGSELIAKHSGKCLDLALQSLAEGANVQQWDCHGKSDQKWTLPSN